MTRDEFTEFAESRLDSPLLMEVLWTAEDALKGPVKPSHFIIVKLDGSSWEKYVSDCCSGEVLCYYFGANEEWWGFTEPSDIIPWLICNV